MRERLLECIQARDAVLWVATDEEERSLQIIMDVAETLGYVVFVWDSTQGFQALNSAQVRLPGDEGSLNVDVALNALESYTQEAGIFVFRDFDLLFERVRTAPDAVPIIRRIRRLSRGLKGGRNVLVFLSYCGTVPEELQSSVSLVRAPLPTAEELEHLFYAWLQANGFSERNLLNEAGVDRLIAAGRGMTADQFLSALARSLVRRKELNEESISDMVEEKTQVVRKTGLLELVPLKEGFESIGGLDLLKDWLRKRVLAYTKPAILYGLPTPRGVLLAGVPGTGKSLTAKAVAHAWQKPLVRLDVGRLYGSLVGESEERWRRAVEIVEGIAPCVLWLDELEKAFAGATGYSGDGGVSRRLFGSLLTWMQEKTAQVFVVATANSVERLPPELLRKGRFDELFFIDLPTASERRAILDVLLKKYRRRASTLVTDDLVARLDKFTGAEIEQVIVDALYDAFFDGQREVTTEDLIRTAGLVVPIADQMRTEIEELRRWGRSQARPASSQKGD